MNNPDEETTVAQFGKGDKYFGICTLLVTLPGLPMFGHGQIEGLAEKYGMEYRRAYWDERVDADMVDRHQREICPLLHRRYLFAEVQNFRLYDYHSPDGHVNQDVFAYSNRVGDERALVVYHNKYADARGWIQTSVPYCVKSGEDGDRALVQETVSEGLGLRNDERCFYLFRDQLTGLEYVRNARDLDEKGLYVELQAYECHVFLDWREVRDNEWHQYTHLSDYLDGRGVPSIEEALREVFLQPVHSAFHELVNVDHLRWLIDNRVTEPGRQLEQEITMEAERRALRLLEEVKQFTRATGAPGPIALEIRRKLETSLCLPILGDRFVLPGAHKCEAAIERIQARLNDDVAAWGALLCWLFTHALGQVVDEKDSGAQSRSWMDEWLLSKLIAGALQDLDLDAGTARWAVGTVRILISHQRWYELAASGPQQAYQVLESWLRDGEVQQFLQVNRYQGVLWFNQEAFEELLDWMLTIAVVAIATDHRRAPEKTVEDIVTCYEVVTTLQEAEEASEYQVAKLLEAAKDENWVPASQL
jgi:hypothetical protein